MDELVGDLCDRTGGREDAGIVDQDVEPGVAGGDVDRVREVGRVGDVAEREVRADRRCVLLCRRVEVRHGDVGAGFAEASGDRRPDALAAAGDEGPLGS